MKKRTKKKPLKKGPVRPASKLILVALKMTRSEHLALKKRAKWFAKGNFSAWIRHAGLRYKPKSGEVIFSVTMPSTKSVIDRHYGVKKKKR